MDNSIKKLYLKYSLISFAINGWELWRYTEEYRNCYFLGITSSGYAQSTLPLQPESTYYTTVRGITNAGNVIEATTDGFVVDVTPPSIKLDR